MNNVQLKGRLTKDIELRQTENDKKFCFFTLACDRPFAKNSDFVECKAFGDMAQSCAEVLKKGDMVSLTGYISSSKYEKDGQKYYTRAVIAEDVAKVERNAESSTPRAVRIMTESDDNEVAE